MDVAFVCRLRLEIRYLAALFSDLGGGVILEAVGEWLLWRVIAIFSKIDLERVYFVNCESYLIFVPNYLL